MKSVSARQSETRAKDAMLT